MSDPSQHSSNGTSDPLGPNPRHEPDSRGEAQDERGGAGEQRSGEAGAHAHGGEHQCLEFCPICRAADIIRASAPPELREQWQTVQREALVTTKALIEHYLARLDEEDRAEPRSRVEDIPIL